MKKALSLILTLAFLISWLPQMGPGVLAEEASSANSLEGKTLSILGDSYVADFVDATGEHTYDGGICTGCGKAELCVPMSMRYDDHMDVAGKAVEIIDAGKPTSYQVGYGVAENTVADIAVVTLEGSNLVAAGCGKAKVRLDGQLYEITVEAAPISLLLLIGQSNMQGSEGDADQSIICPNGMVYSTYGDRYTMTVNNATDFAPSALTGNGSALNVNGTTTNLENWPVYLLNEAGAGKAGPDSGFAYEWVKQTGEKVWVVNAAHGGSAISTWQDGGANYEECVLLFQACQETLRKEIAAGHYTLSHTGYFWCQGCSDSQQTAEWYVRKYLALHNNLKTELAFDEDTTFEFGGIIPILYGVNSYRKGVCADINQWPYYESFEQLFFNGPRVAQYWMINNPDLPDIWGVCNIGEDWVWMPDGTNGVTEYFQAHYPGGTVDYTTQVKQSASWYTPTTPKAVHDSIHYNQIGYNEVGREAARNALILLGETEKPTVETVVELLTWDGYTEVTQVPASTTGNSASLVVPVVYPLWKSKNVTYELSEGLRWDYYDLLVQDYRTSGTLTVIGADGNSVSVINHELSSYRWDLEDGVLVSTGNRENIATLLQGSIIDGLFVDTRYQLADPIRLLHDMNWILEWKMTGPWYDAATTSQKLFCQDGGSATPGSMCLLIKGNEHRITLGYYGTNTHISYGCKLDALGIDMADTHTYRLVNHINDDGSNTIFLFVDGKQIGPMTRYFTGSGGDMGTESNALSGVDFAFQYLGTPKYSLNNGVIEYISVVETGASSDIHFHDWSDWEVITEPGPDGSGMNKRVCTCGETETREILSIWQTTNLAQHIQSLPENTCCGLNLWAVLNHDSTYYVNSKGDWDYHSSRDVPSITIPVNSGDRIFATSFGAADVNGHGSANGIRVTWFDVNGVLKTTDPAGTYSEFSNNGGYLIAPEGAIAVNIPLWGDSEDHEVYICNRDHTYDGGICTGCGDNPYAGKTLVCIGDSITYGVGANGNPYHKILGEDLGMNVTNLGASGWVMCTGGHRNCRINVLTEENCKGKDVVTIFLGINDWANAVKDGYFGGKLTYEPGKSYYALGELGSDDTSTIYGAMKMWCEKIAELRQLEGCKNTEFYFITPVITSWNNSVTGAKNWDQSKTNIHGYTLRDMCNAIIEVCGQYDVPVIDLNLISGMYYNSPEDNNVEVFGGDGVHPGEVGHQMMAEAIRNALLRNHLREDHTHTYGSWITTTYPGCEGGQQQRVCSVCTAVEQRTVEAIGHSYNAAVTASTCTEQGYTTYTCACGDSYVADFVDATGEHTYDGGICTGCGKVQPEWLPVPLTNTQNSDHLAYRIEDGVLTFHDFGDPNSADYGRMPDYTNSAAVEDKYNITQWYQTRHEIHEVVFDETICHIGSYNVTNMDRVTRIEIRNPEAETAKNAVLFSTTNRPEPLRIYAASTVQTVDGWIRGSGYKPISEMIADVALYCTDLEEELQELEALLKKDMQSDDLYRALQLAEQIPQNRYTTSDYKIAFVNEDALERLRMLSSGSCGAGVTYQLQTTEQEGKLNLMISGKGAMEDYTDPAQAPWYSVADCISDVTVDEGITDICSDILPANSVYHVKLNSDAYRYAIQRGLTVKLDTLRVLVIGNSHTADYSDFLRNILRDLEASGMETEVTVDRAVIGSIGLYSGRNSNVSSAYYTQQAAIRDKAGAYSNLVNKRYDLVIVQDYMESIIDTPDVFEAGLASMIKTVKDLAAQNGQGQPQVAWFADWVDIRSTGGDTALYDGQGQKIYLENRSREEVYATSLANIARIQESIRAGVANMPDFVIRGVTVKQNAMSSYLGQTKLFDKNRFCILERDTTHASYELGRYLMGAGVIHEVVEHYRNVLMLPKDLTVVGALTLENGPVTSGYGSQSDGAMNAEVLEIVREAISSPEAFRQSVFTTDPVDSLAAQLHKTVWDLSSVQDEDSALEASHSQIGAVLDGKVDEWSVYMKSYVSADSFTVRIRMRHGYSIREEEISVTRYAPGDLNGDGKWNNKDVTRLMQYLAGWDVETAVPPDINGDGKLNNKDVTRLMQYLAGWDVEIHGPT